MRMTNYLDIDNVRQNGLISVEIKTYLQTE